MQAIAGPNNTTYDATEVDVHFAFTPWLPPAPWPEKSEYHTIIGTAPQLVGLGDERSGELLQEEEAAGQRGDPA